ncbi:MAG: hypothetical protein JWM85_932 [Acidimicrobiaceae bacterium]|nr:hypothetical protein [Acidimicrobiaceae bacterium]
MRQAARVLQRDVVIGRGDHDAAEIAGHLRHLVGHFLPEMSLRTDGQNRAADRVGALRPVLCGASLAGAVHLHDGRGATSSAIVAG